MRVLIDNSIVPTLKEFYAESIRLHPTLDEAIVHAKIDRLLNAIAQLGDFPNKYPLAQYKQSWKEKKYHDFVFEDIHVGYKVVMLSTGERVVYAADVCHSKLYHD